MTYQDAGATFHEAEQIQAHLQVQDDAMDVLLEQVETLEAALARARSRQARQLGRFHPHSGNGLDAAGVAPAPPSPTGAGSSARSRARR